MRGYRQRNPKWGDWRWANFQMQVALASCDQVIFEISLICFFSMPSLPNLKQNLEKSYIIGKFMKLHAWMKGYFLVILYS